MNTTTHASAPHDAHAHHGAEHNDIAHVAPAKLLVTIFVLLLVFTGITVFLAKNFHFAGLEVWIAMIIATIKAVLVGLYFMHLRDDNPFNTLVFLSSFMFVGIFIGATMTDTHQYKPSVVWEDKPPIGGASLASPVAPNPAPNTPATPPANATDATTSPPTDKK